MYKIAIITSKSVDFNSDLLLSTLLKTSESFKKVLELNIVNTLDIFDQKEIHQFICDKSCDLIIDYVIDDMNFNEQEIENFINFRKNVRFYCKQNNIKTFILSSKDEFISYQFADIMSITYPNLYNSLVDNEISKFVNNTLEKIIDFDFEMKEYCEVNYLSNFILSTCVAELTENKSYLESKLKHNNKFYMTDWNQFKEIDDLFSYVVGVKSVTNNIFNDKHSAKGYDFLSYIDLIIKQFNQKKSEKLDDNFLYNDSITAKFSYSTMNGDYESEYY